jgi:acyl dehydratase
LNRKGFAGKVRGGTSRFAAAKTRPGTTVREIEFDEIPTLVGQELALTEWRTITQEQVGLFADATGDHQWIHVDPARATRESPFGGPVAHGFLTLSLLPSMLAESIRVKGVAMSVNYGLNRVRFTFPVRVGAELRGRVTIQSADSLAPADTLTGGPGWQIVWAVTFELRGQDRPACVAEMVSRQFAAPVASLSVT